MKKVLVSILKVLGIYNFLLNKKKYIDKRKLEKEEVKNYAKRMAFYGEFLTKDDLVFDVGANIGNRTAVFLELGAKVIAVEPQPDCIEILKKKFGAGIIYEPVGLGSSSGELEMYVADETTISTFSKEFIDKTKQKFSRNSWEKSIKVQITTLDQLIRKHGKPEFCKIDVEGFETEVLSGLSSLINKISFEYNVPELIENVRNNISIISRLSSDYEFNYSIGETMKMELNHWKSAAEFIEWTHTSQFMNSDFGDIYAFVKKTY